MNSINKICNFIKNTAINCLKIITNFLKSFIKACLELYEDANNIKEKDPAAHVWKAEMKRVDIMDATLFW